MAQRYKFCMLLHDKDSDSQFAAPIVSTCNYIHAAKRDKGTVNGHELAGDSV